MKHITMAAENRRTNSSRLAVPRRAATDPLLTAGAVAGVVGVLMQAVLEGFVHPSAADPNDSAAAFREYAAFSSWTAVHLGQFVAVLLVSVALVALALHLRSARGWAATLGTIGALSVVVATAVFAVQMAVDGVALKHAADVWTRASAGAPQDGAFAVAETVRAIEKGLSALFHLLNGTALLTLGVGMASTHRQQWLGWIGAGAGVGYLGGAWSTAHTGFSSQASAVLLPAAALSLVFVIGISLTLWRWPGR